MANVKILERKQNTIDEIAEKIKSSNAVVWFDNNGLSVSDLTSLRRKLRENDCELKVYKNTLTMRALSSLKIELENLEGPKIMAFGEDAVMPIKIVNDFAKDHPELEMKVGIVEGNVTEIDTLKKLATIPSREGLLTMFAGGLLEHVKNVAICLDLHAQNLEKNN